MPSATDEPELTYFGIQSEWGITKHLGGQPATDRLAELCGLSPASLTAAHVLIVGSGAGASAAHIAQAYNCRVTGIDLSPRMIAWAQERIERNQLADQAKFCLANAQLLPFPTNFFDAVLSESVTAFIPDKPRAFSEYVRVARPGGFVGLNEGTWMKPPPPDLEAYVRASMGGVDFLPADRWQALLAGSGLQITACEIVRITARSQRRAEMAGLDRHDWGRHLRAYGRILQLLITNPRFRAYTRSLLPSREVIRGLFEHLGYGLYIGRKL